jgi:hypothetical protein
MIVPLWMPHVFFATTKDKEWSVSSWTFLRYDRCTLSSQGEMYMLKYLPPSRQLQVFQIDPPHHRHGSSLSLLMPPKLVATFPPSDGNDYIIYDLAECDSDVLVIFIIGITHFEVYRVADLIQGRIVAVKSIGGGAIFVFNKMCLGLSHGAVPAIAGDTVVRYTMDRPLQYHLGSGTWLPLEDGWGPCSFIHHIYNSCRCDKTLSSPST